MIFFLIKFKIYRFDKIFKAASSNSLLKLLTRYAFLKTHTRTHQTRAAAFRKRGDDYELNYDYNNGLFSAKKKTKLIREMHLKYIVL